MKFLQNLKVSKKLALGFGACIAFLLVIAYVSFTSMTRLRTVVINMDDDAVTGLNTIANTMDDATHTQFENLEMLASPPSELPKVVAKRDGFIASAKKNMDAYDATIAHEEDRKNFEAFKEVWKQYLAKSSHYGDIVANGHTEAARAYYYGELADAYKPVDELTDKIVNYNKQLADDYVKSAKETAANGIRLIVTFTLLSILASIVLGVLISRQITRPIASLRNSMTELNEYCVTHLQNGIAALESGDLTYDAVSTTKPLKVESSDELGELANTFNSLLSKCQSAINSFGNSQQALTQIVAKLKDASSSVSHASVSLTATAQHVESAGQEVSASMGEIASASMQAARGAAEVATGSSSQAQALSQSTYSIKRLVESIESVAKDAELAAQAAESAGKAAADGTEVVGTSMKGMTAIRNTVAQSASVIQTLGESSNKIGTIVQTINEIAEQTNLLALNAAIEAARAGDAGRGFAVVADEVRKLAERSGGATREIGTLISEIQAHTSRAVAAMEAGTKEVEAQGKIAESTQLAFTKIQDVFKLVAERVEDIRTASADMSGASQEVARSITEVAAVVEESSAAAEELSASAEQVSASVDTVAGAARQQSAAVSDLVVSSDQLQQLSDDLLEIVDGFRVNAESASSTQLYLHKAA